MKILLPYLFVLHSLLVYSQNKIIDSLRAVLLTQAEDTNRVNTLNELCYQTINYDPKNTFQQINTALTLAKKLHFEKGLANAHNNLGQFYRLEGNYPKALTEHLNAVQLSQQINEKKELSRSYFNVGYTYGLDDKYPSALKYLFLSLKVSEQINDSANIVRAMIEIGRNYMYQGDNVNERKQYEAALKYVTKPLADQNFLALNLDVMHALYRLGNYQKSFNWATAALKIHEELRNVKGLAHDHTQLAYIFDRWGDSMVVLGKTELAKKYYAEAARNYQEAEDKFYAFDSISALGKMNVSAINAEAGNFFIKIRNSHKAQLCFNKSIRFSKQLGQWMNLREGYYGLYRLDSAKGNYAQALSNYKLFVLYEDSLTNKENLLLSEKSRLQHNFDKTQDSLKAVQDKKTALAAAELRNQKIIRNFSITGAIVLLASGCVSFYRYRRRRKLQSQQDMLNERLRISRELHDDIGSTLGSISIYSEVAKNRAEKNENAREAISKIGIASRDLIDKMSDIVWSINPNNESFDQLQNRMQALAAVMLTPRDIENNFVVDEELKSVQLTTEERKNIYLVLKEALHNIAKYAECSHVEIKLSIVDSQLIMTIIDNGKGFILDNTYAYNGNGLRNMQKRASDINAILKIHSAIHEGTTIELILNV